MVSNEHSYASYANEEVETSVYIDVNTDVNTSVTDDVVAEAVSADARPDASAEAGASAAGSADDAEADLPENADEDIEMMDFEAIRARNTDFINSKKNVNTLKKIKLCANRFNDWLDKHGEDCDIKNIDIKMLDQYLALFLTDIRKPGGKEYEPVTLQSFSNSIRKHIAQVKDNVDEDTDFETAKTVLKAKKKDLKQKGLGNTPNKAKVLSEEDEEILWNSGALGDGDPEALIQTVWYLSTKLLGLRGQNEARQMQWGDMVEVKENGVTYLEWNERLTKTRDGINGDQ